MYSINLGAWQSVFAVPCSVVDKELKKANPDYVVVLLWVLRHAGEAFSAQKIHADLPKIAVEAVEEALLYWRQQKLLTCGGDGEFVPAQQEAAASDFPAGPKTGAEPQPPAVAEAAPAPAAGAQKKLLSRPQKPDNAFVAQRMAECDEIAFLMQEAQQILGRLLSNGTSAMLLMIHDDFGLPTDVILMLLQYAVSIGKTSSNYIEKAALDWAEDEIFTHERAEEKLRRLSENSRAWRVVEQELGISHRSPTKVEDSMAGTWVLEWGFAPELIREAYERCVNQTGRLSMKYIHKILERWHRGGIKTLQQTAQEQQEKAAARKRTKDAATSYDLDELERSGAFYQ